MADGSAEDVSMRRLNRLKKVANTNFARFALEVEHLSTEVQTRLIEQLPEFRKLATGALEDLREAHRNTLTSVERGEDRINQAFEQWRGALLTLLGDSDLSLDDKLRITAEIGRTVKEQTSAQKESSIAKFAALGSVAASTALVVGAVVVAVTGGETGRRQRPEEQLTVNATRPTGCAAPARKAPRRCSAIGTHPE